MHVSVTIRALSRENSPTSSQAWPLIRSAVQWRIIFTGIIQWLDNPGHFYANYIFQRSLSVHRWTSQSFLSRSAGLESYQRWGGYFPRTWRSQILHLNIHSYNQNWKGLHSYFTQTGDVCALCTNMMFHCYQTWCITDMKTNHCDIPVKLPGVLSIIKYLTFCLPLAIVYRAKCDQWGWPVGGATHVLPGWHPAVSAAWGAVPQPGPSGRAGGNAGGPLHTVSSTTEHLAKYTRRVPRRLSNHLWEIWFSLSRVLWAGFSSWGRISGSRQSLRPCVWYWDPQTLSVQMTHFS